MAELVGTAFCDKNAWYAGNNLNYGPEKINDGSLGTRWIGAAVSATDSLQNFCGIRFSGTADVTEVRINFASWGRNIRIGTWAAGVDPAGASFTKANIIPIRSIDAFISNDDDNVGMVVGVTLRFAITATQIPGLVFYCDDNGYSQLTNTSGTTNTNQSINEVFVTGIVNNPLIKQNGTAIASSQYNDFGLVSAVNDNNTATGWSGGGVNANSALDWVALQFASPQKIKKLDVYIYSWGKTILVGYASTVPGSKTGFTVVRTIDVTVTPNDDLGIPWGRLKTNTILIPDNQASATIWGVFTNDSGANILGVGGGAVDRLRMMELNMYSDGTLTPAGPPGVNPKPPATVPVIPYNAATPASWVKTEFSTKGDFTFTPAIDTSVVLVVAQGAGAGGRVNYSITGPAVPDNTTRQGGDTIISNPAGQIVVAPGGKSNLIPDAALFSGNNGTPCDWLRIADQNGRAGALTAVTSAAGQPGGLAYIGGSTAGSALTLAAQQTNYPAVAALNTFTGSAAIPLAPVFSGSAFRSATSGLTVSAQNDSVTLTFNGLSGQVLTVPYIVSGSTQFAVTLNGVGIDSATASGNFSRTYTLTTTGNQVLVFSKVSAGASTMGMGSITFSNYGQGGALSGASGRLAQMFLLPEPLTFTVGGGGVGQPGGQAVTAAHNGTRGSGGGVGGNGGDGVVIIYEYKGTVVNDKTPQPLFNTYNQNITLEVLAGYRTNYFGTASNTAGLGWNTQTAFTHKLRPRTKFVLALMTGPGGQYRSTNIALEPEQGVPTVLTSGAISNTAESGWMGKTYGGSTGNGGAGGDMQAAPNVLFGEKGRTGYGSGQTEANPSVIAGGYGSGGQSNYLNTAGGGCGGYGLVLISPEQFAADRTLQLLVGNTGTSATPGAIFLYETESDYGPFITQLAESILRAETNAATTTSQTAEQFLLKNTNAATTTSQTAEQILYTESNSTNNLQVSHAHIAFVVDADDPSTAITQTTEMALLREKQAPTAVSGSVEQVFMRMGNLPWRITQVAELVFAAELPSVFWLNFGTLQYPLIKHSYDSSAGRATSVQPGAYIQLESPHMDGTTLVVNGVETGLSSPIANNDQVFIRGGITNFYQREMNVYTYYTKNGVIARELVGQWKFVREDLVPTISRKYSEPYTNATWIKTKANYGIGNLIPLLTRALSATGATLTALYENGRSALAGLTSMFTKALTGMFGGNGAVVSQNNHELFEGPEADFMQAKPVYAEGPKSIITVAQDTLSEPIDGEGASSPNTNLQAWNGYEQMIPGAEPVTMLEFEQSQHHIDHYVNTDFEGNTQVGFGQWTAIDYLTGNPVGFALVHKDYEYNAVGKSYSSEQEYTAIYNSGTGKPFTMGFMGTIAYSVLAEVSYTKNSGIGTGNWLMPEGQADITRTGFGFVQMNGAERAIAHPHLTDRTVERDGGKNLGYFGASPIMHKVGFGHFEQTVVKSSVNSGTVERIVIHTQHYLALANLTAYRPAEAISGRGAASLYMGFDTLQDVQDYTEQFAGVTTLAAYNGFVYNLEVDKSFVCEIYFNGPVSGLIQGG
jgi:hypothetical protein